MKEDPGVSNEVMRLTEVTTNRVDPSATLIVDLVRGKDLYLGKCPTLKKVPLGNFSSILSYMDGSEISLRSSQKHSL